MSEGDKGIQGIQGAQGEHGDREEQGHEEPRYLFSYGSNSTAQLSARVGASLAELDVRPARLPHWTRIFCGLSQAWGFSGVASIHPAAADDEVRGTVCRVTDAQIARLDSFEGSYARHEVQPLILAGAPGEEPLWELVTASAYVARDPRWVAPPTEQYLCAIHCMLREAGALSPAPVAAPVALVVADASTAARATAIAPSPPAPANAPTSTTAAGASSASQPPELPRVDHRGSAALRQAVRDTRDIDVCGVLEPPPTQNRDEAGDGLAREAPQAVRLFGWRHPGTCALSLQALCVEVSCRRRQPWVMPRTIGEVVAKLAKINVHSAAQLAAELARAPPSGGKLHLNELLRAQDLRPFSAETVGLMMQLLGIDYGEDGEAA